MADQSETVTSSDFGGLLRRYRLAAGLSQEALAERARMSVNGIGALERGYRRSPQRETLALLSRALALNGPQHQAFEAAAARRVRLRRRDGRVAIGPWPEPPNETLPFALTSFIGRRKERGEIAALIRQHRLVTITGAGGVGKTQTALHVAAGFGRASSLPVRFVGLARIKDSSLILHAIASAIGVQEVPSRSVMDTLVAYLNNKPLLLVLDNCEHIVAGVAQTVEALLLKCPQIRVLATSREPIAAADERVCLLPSLVPSEAMALFGDRAQGVDPHFALNDKNASAIAEICQRLGGIPLAIELAAAHLYVLSLAALANGLDDSLRILVGGKRTALPRQQTMRATIDWSYDLLSNEERRVFERLSVFAGGCTLASATAVCAADDVPKSSVLELLSSLIKKSLVLADLESNEPRYWMLESFRQYAHTKLVERGEEDATARRHALASLRMAEWFNSGFEFIEATTLRARAGYEQANWRAALQWTLRERHDVKLGQELAGRLAPCFSFFLASARDAIFFGHMEGRRWLAEALSLVDETTPENVVAALQYALARIAGNLREYRAELDNSRIALDHYRAIGDALGIVRTETTFGHALLYLGQRAESKQTLQEAVRLVCTLDDKARFSYACLLRLLAIVDNDVRVARKRINEAIAIHKGLAHENSLPMALLDLSECEQHAGNFELALERAEESLAAAPPGNAFVRCTALYGSSLCLAALNRDEESAERALNALAVAREYRFAIYVAWSLEQVATLAMRRSRGEAQRRSSAYASAARIFGFVDARLAAMGSARLPSAKQSYQRALDKLRAAMGTVALGACMAEGASMTEDQAVEEATT